jgi:hypothetical protein
MNWLKPMMKTALPLARPAPRALNPHALARGPAVAPGWRRSGIRTGLQPNSLVSGNFTGNFAILRLRDTIWYEEAPALQPLLDQFPTQIIRENILRIRDFLSDNREYSCEIGFVDMRNGIDPLAMWFAGVVRQESRLDGPILPAVYGNGRVAL